MTPPRFKIFVIISSLKRTFCYYLPLERGYPPFLNKLESHSPKDDLCKAWLKLALWFCRRFLNDPTHFYIFVIISPLKRTWVALFQTNLNSLHQMIICAKFDWIWPAGSKEEDFFFNFQCIFTLLLLSPLGERLSPSFEKKLEYPWPKDNLCQVWLKLVQWFCRRRFSNDSTPN
jgi:hypothetical protein